MATEPAAIPVDLRSDGVLWMINRAVFHPRGFALGVEVGSGALVLYGDGSGPWRFELDDEDEIFRSFEGLLARAREVQS